MSVGLATTGLTDGDVMPAKKKSAPHRLMNWWPGCGRPKPKVPRPRDAGTVRLNVLGSASRGTTPEEVENLVARWRELAGAMEKKVKALSKGLKRSRKGRRRRVVKRGELSLLGTTWRIPHIQITVVASLTPHQADALIRAEQCRPKTWKGLKDGSSDWFDFKPIPLAIRITYPLGTVVVLEYTPPASTKACRYFMSVGHVLWHVAKAYQKIYEEAEEDEFGQQKYGIWGHSIDDLVFDGITIREDGVVDLSIGS